MSNRKPFKVGQKYVWAGPESMGLVYTIIEVVRPETRDNTAQIILTWPGGQPQTYFVRRDQFRKYKEPRKAPEPTDPVTTPKTLAQSREALTRALSDHEDAVLRTVRDKLIARGDYLTAAFVNPDDKHPDFGWDDE